MNITFCSVSSTAKHIKAFSRVRRDFRSETRDRLLPVTGRRGAYDFGSDLGPLEIPCRFEVFADSQSDLQTYSREISMWLNDEGYLIFGDDSDIRYYARPIGRVSKDIIGNDGVGQVTFLVPDGYAWSNATRLVSPNRGEETPVQITAAMASSSTGGITISLSTDRRILINTEIASTGTVFIDTNTREVTIDGDDVREYVSFASEFFKLPKDSTFDISASSSNVTVSFEYRERW